MTSPLASLLLPHYIRSFIACVEVTVEAAENGTGELFLAFQPHSNYLKRLAHFNLFLGTRAKRPLKPEGTRQICW